MYDVFSFPEVKFPDDFLWGSSTAGHQIEGDNVNSQLWRIEQEKDYPEKSGKACNHWELYQEDIELLFELGHQAYRMSIEWSRIEPEQGKIDEAAIAHYLDELQLIKKKGIKVFLTLHHFTHPQWFEELGAFREYDNLKYFEKYLKFIVPKVAPLVDSWNVFNEFNLSSNTTLKFNCIRAHAMGYHIIKQYSSAPVSTAHAFVDWFPYRRHDKFDNIARDLIDWKSNEFFFHAIRTGEFVFPEMDAEEHPEVKGTMDYWAVNTYVRHMVNSRLKKMKGPRFIHKELKMIDKDFYLEEMFPESLISNLERLKDLPVYITENGCACNDDDWRIVWIALYLCALKEAMDRGVDVKGYIHWSTMDNYEWTSFLPRFGLVDVDFETFKRTPKPSAYYFRDIIKNNGFSAATTKKYLKKLPTFN